MDEPPLPHGAGRVGRARPCLREERDHRTVEAALHFAPCGIAQADAPVVVDDRGVFRFIFPQWLPIELKKVGFEPDAPLLMTRSGGDKRSDGGSLQRLTSTHRARGEAFRIQIGLCGGSPWATANIIPATSSQPEGAAAAPVTVREKPLLSANWKQAFDCGKNHVDSWPNGTNTFGDTNRSVQLTFTRMNEGTFWIFGSGGLHTGTCMRW